MGINNKSQSSPNHLGGYKRIIIIITEIVEIPERIWRQRCFLSGLLRRVGPRRRVLAAVRRVAHQAGLAAVRRVAHQAGLDTATLQPDKRLICKQRRGPSPWKTRLQWRPQELLPLTRRFTPLTSSPASTSESPSAGPVERASSSPPQLLPSSSPTTSSPSPSPPPPLSQPSSAELVVPRRGGRELFFAGGVGCPGNGNALCSCCFWLAASLPANGNPFSENLEGSPIGLAQAHQLGLHTNN